MLFSIFPSLIQKSYPVQVRNIDWSQQFGSQLTTQYLDHSLILNEVDVDYDTLMKILTELRAEGSIK